MGTVLSDSRIVQYEAQGAIRYVACQVRKVGRRQDSAILVRSTDRFGNFDAEWPELPSPSALQHG
jgi:hypothetical protein